MKNYQISLYKTITKNIEVPVQYGDVNMDGRIDEKDILKIQDFLKGVDNLTEKEKELADVTKDGIVDETDISKISAFFEGRRKEDFGNSSYYRQEYQYYERDIAEIGSSESEFLGKAIDPIFSSRLDGTHELSFSLPQKYFDETTGEEVFNDIVNELKNKTKIRLRITNNEKENEYYFVINDRTDSDRNGTITYTYTCSDAFIEELSKTGYGINYSSELGGNGFDTIHNLAEIALKDSDWIYDRGKTGLLLEYSTEQEYKDSQARYDTVYTPVPVAKTTYNKELERDCYVLDRKYKDKNIYCYETSEQITTNTSKNILYGSSNFSDTSAWTSFTVSGQDKAPKAHPGFPITPYKYTANNKNYYSMLVKKSTDNDNAETYMFNSTAADVNTTIHSNQPYLFKFSVGKSTKGYVRAIYLTKDNPLIKSEIFKSPQNNADYALAGPDTYIEKDKNGKIISEVRNVFLPDTYYVIKTKTTITNPYVTLRVNCGEKGENLPIYFYHLCLFEAIGKNTKELPEDNSEENNGALLSYLYNGSRWGATLTDEYVKWHVKREMEIQYADILKNGTEDEIKEIQDQIEASVENASVNLEKYTELFKTIAYPLGCAPTESPLSTISAYTQKRISYFCYDEETNNFTYLSEEEIFSETELASVIEFDDFPSEIVYSAEFAKYEENSLNIEHRQSIFYRSKKDRKLYQYYELKKGDRVNGVWNFAGLGHCINDKKRSLTLEKSNRFNILQEIAQLFKVWCVFDIKTTEDGKFEKRVWFKEGELKENFSGFHKGINLIGLERRMDSNDLVTKIYVEDQENEHSENGLVTVADASTNPWGENYFYNFRHYVEQGFLNDYVEIDGTKKLLVDHELNELYSYIKQRNFDLKKQSGLLIALEKELRELEKEIKSYQYLESSLLDQIASATANIESPYISATDKKREEDNIKSWTTRQTEYAEMRKELEKQKDELQDDIDSKQLIIESFQHQKLKRITDFEKKYAAFIKEGVWSDNSYIDNEAYFLDAQKVLNTSSIPQAEWEISGIDISVLEDMDEMSFEVGDKTFLIDDDFFGTHPQTGESYIFEVLISGIEKHLDNEISNKIEVKNYHTSFEDLFQRISAATQTLELNESIYNKAAYFTADHQVDESILQNTLLNNDLVLLNSSNNSYSLDANGIYLQSTSNPANKLRAVAEGIFLSNSLNFDTGLPEWKTGITAEGINASLLNAGQINTSLIKIYSDGQPNFTWGELGITAYAQDGTTESQLSEMGNVIFIGDSYTKDYYYENGQQINNGGEGWPEKVARLIGLESTRFKNMGEGGSGFCPPNNNPKFLSQLEKTYEREDIDEEIKKWNSNVTHIIIGGGFNERTVDTTTPGVSVSELKEAIENFSDEVNKHYKNAKVFLIPLGCSEISPSKNNDLTNNIYPAYQEVAKKAGWNYYDIHRQWWQPKVTGQEPRPGMSLGEHCNDNFYGDGYHPSQKGKDNMARLIYQSLLSTLYTGNSFIRFDSFGVYGSKEGAWFNYDSENRPWFKGYTRTQALEYIEENSLFSLTENGFNLNVGSTSGRIKLGYFNSTRDKYGLYITDAKGDSIVSLQNDGECYLSGWKITSTTFFNSRIRTVKVDGKNTDQKLVYYMATPSESDTNYVLAIGAINPSDSNFTNAQFTVTNEGVLTAKGAILKDLKVSEGSTIAAFTITENGLRYDSNVYEKEVNGVNKKYKTIFTVLPYNKNYYSEKTSLALGEIPEDGEDIDCPFRVTNAGKLYATNATISGKMGMFSVGDEGISYTYDKDDGGSGYAFKINKSGLAYIYEGTTTDVVFAFQINDTSAKNGTSYNAIAIGERPHNSTNYSDCPFRVTSKGVLTAKGANIEGTLSAKTSEEHSITLTSLRHEGEEGFNRSMPVIKFKDPIDSDENALESRDIATFRMSRLVNKLTLGMWEIAVGLGKSSWDYTKTRPLFYLWPLSGGSGVTFAPVYEGYFLEGKSHGIKFIIKEDGTYRELYTSGGALYFGDHQIAFYE